MVNLNIPIHMNPLTSILIENWRNHIKLVFGHGEEIFIGRETMYEKIKNLIYYFDHIKL